MVFSVSSLKGVSLHATNGDIGSLRDLYIDDFSWVVRYFVAETGPLIFGKEVLISPASVEAIDPQAHRIHVDLTVDEIKGSPSIDLRKPVSRREEERFLQYYNLTPYWAGPDIWATAAYARGLPSLEEERPEEEESETKGDDSESRLRSCAEIRGYAVEGFGGAAGYVEDFLAEYETWKVRYIVIDTHKLFPGKRVLVSPDWVEEIRWTDRTVRVGLDNEVMKNAPSFEGVNELDDGYEATLREHYGTEPGASEDA
jgi:hypothetical protein